MLSLSLYTVFEDDLSKISYLEIAFDILASIVYFKMIFTFFLSSDKIDSPSILPYKFI